MGRPTTVHRGRPGRMTSVRTMPIRVSPIPGEAIDSWLEVLAHRTHTAWADLLSAVGLDAPNSAANSGWVVQILPGESAAISAATGLAGPMLDTMTLARYAHTALRIDPATRSVSRAFPWSRAGASRYCPYCLADTDGRWQLAWRLAWSFACLEHHCLLADTCPQCGRAQRYRGLAGHIVPMPGHCANPATNGGRARARCNADLTNAVAHFRDDHPVLTAQRVV